MEFLCWLDFLPLISRLDKKKTASKLRSHSLQVCGFKELYHIFTILSVVLSVYVVESVILSVM